MSKCNQEEKTKGKNFIKNAISGCILITGISIVCFFGLLLVIFIVDTNTNPEFSSSNNKNSPSPTSTSTPTSTSKTSITYYLAINKNIPAPEDPVPVADYETMQALIRAAEGKDQEKYKSLLQSPSVSLVYGGGIVFIRDRKDGLVKVEIMGKSVDGDVSGQTLWTSERFIQSRQF